MVQSCTGTGTVPSSRPTTHGAFTPAVLESVTTFALSSRQLTFIRLTLQYAKTPATKNLSVSGEEEARNDVYIASSSPWRPAYKRKWQNSIQSKWRPTRHAGPLILFYDCAIFAVATTAQLVWPTSFVGTDG